MKRDISIPDLAGCLAIVTGATSGLGLAITKRLAFAGAEVIMAIRNYEKGIQVINEIRKNHPKAKLGIQIVDMSLLQSVKEFAERLINLERPVNYLINNAGLMTGPERFTTSEGFELHFAANYLGHFALTARLFPLLSVSGTSRVTMMSSSTSRFGTINFEDLQYQKKYSSSKAYAQSKLAILMFAIELNNRGKKYGSGIISNAAHPGATLTNILNSNTAPCKGIVKQSIFQTIGMKIPGIWQAAEQGCLPALFAATSPDAVGGAYYGPDGIFELNGFPQLAKIPVNATNEGNLKNLWKISEQLAGVQFLH